MVSA
jgi:hypothetical protein